MGSRIDILGRVTLCTQHLSTDGHSHLFCSTGACDGTLSCSTCHLIVDPEWFDKITDPLTEEEEDMLDLAYGLSDT